MEGTSSGGSSQWPGYLPRLPGEYYRGDAVVHWSLSIRDRATGWLSERVHARFRELMLHAAARERLLCPVYCLMPDHIHVVWMGLDPSSDQRRGMAFLRTYLKPKLAPARFQPQAHDRVLRSRQRERGAFAKLCFYVLANPVREELVTQPDEWPFGGAVVPGYPRLAVLDEGFWDRFWAIHERLMHPDAGKIVRPPFAVRGRVRMKDESG